MLLTDNIQNVSLILQT